MSMNQDNTRKSVAIKFASAGMAGCFADAVTFPFDTAKVRLQLQGEGGAAPKPSPKKGIVNPAKKLVRAVKYHGVYGTLATVAKEEGLLAIYNGIIPGLQRQLAFCTIRIGCYDSVKSAYSRTLHRANDNVSIGIRMLAGLTTGAMAVSLAQPTEVVKIRLQGQCAKAAPAAGGRHYTGALDAYRTIARQENIRGLWRGVTPNITRNSIVNCCEIVVYDVLKEQILKRRLLPDTIACHFTAGLGAGFITTCVSSPIDVIKTRMMNSSPGQYKGIVDCGLKTLYANGLTGFYKGFFPSFLRIASWNICMFIMYEQLQKSFNKAFL